MALLSWCITCLIGRQVWIGIIILYRTANACGSTVEDMGVNHRCVWDHVFWGSGWNSGNRLQNPHPNPTDRRIGHLSIIHSLPTHVNRKPRPAAGFRRANISQT